MEKIKINPVSTVLDAELQHKIDTKTKPLGALGKLEKIAFRLGQIQQTLFPKIVKPTILLFAGDHGLTAEGVSPYPQAVTQQMVLNFLNEGAAINVLAKQAGAEVKVIDAGVNATFDPTQFAGLIDKKIGMGTQNSAQGVAMTAAECDAALSAGREIVNETVGAGSNLIGFGEMGIGNTSAAALIMHFVCGIPLKICVGRGTGVDDAGLKRKLEALERTADFHQVLYQEDRSPLEILAAVGGFELAQIAGGMMQAAAMQTPFIVDGFIVTAAYLIAEAVYPEVREYAFFAHLSNEQGHATMLQYLKAEPLLNLGMRLGEGTGAAMALPIFQASVRFLNEMASFESAGVSQNESA